MLIVATQDNYLGEKWCLWDTIYDEFVGVNLSKEEAIEAVLKFKGDKYTRQDAVSRVEHAQKFRDIADVIE